MKKIKLSLIAFACLLSLSIHSQIEVEFDTLTTIEKNKQLVTIWYEQGWNQKEYEELIPVLFAENWTDGNPIRPDQFDGHAGMLFMVNSYLKAFPDLKFNITHMVADEKLVSVRMDATGTHKGEIFGIKPTGKEVNTSVMVFFEIENEQITVTWQEMDLSGLINQLTEKLVSGN